MLCNEVTTGCCFLLIAGVGGSDISTEHCRVQYKGHRVSVHPMSGDCFINHKRLRKPTKLSQGTSWVFTVVINTNKRKSL